MGEIKKLTKDDLDRFVVLAGQAAESYRYPMPEKDRIEFKKQYDEILKNQEDAEKWRKYVFYCMKCVRKFNSIEETLNHEREKCHLEGFRITEEQNTPLEFTKEQLTILEGKND